MKIIRVTDDNDTIKIDFHPDSAILLPGRPFFMPEFGSGWRAKVMIAARIGRLGKNISLKYASRYFDAATLALFIYPTDTEVDSGILSALDSSVVIGEWQGSDLITGAIDVEAGSSQVSVAPAKERVEEVISEVSKYATLKMGDVILLPAGGIEIPLAEGEQCELCANSVSVLRLKVV